MTSKCLPDWVVVQQCCYNLRQVLMVICWQCSSVSLHWSSPVWGRGTPLPPLSIYFLIFSPFYFFLSFLGFTYFYLLSIPSLSTRTRVQGEGSKVKVTTWKHRLIVILLRSSRKSESLNLLAMSEFWSKAAEISSLCACAVQISKKNSPEMAE